MLSSSSSGQRIADNRGQLGKKRWSTAPQKRFLGAVEEYCGECEEQEWHDEMAVGMTVTCHKCGGIGHYARDCPSKGKGKGGKGMGKTKPSTPGIGGVANHNPNPKTHPKIIPAKVNSGAASASTAATPPTRVAQPLKVVKSEDLEGARGRARSRTAHGVGLGG